MYGRHGAKVSPAATAGIRSGRSSPAGLAGVLHTVLFAHPNVVTENYKEYEEDIAWRDDDEELAAWKAGETGYPIVDAGMRQLREEAYMHNRVRMIVASFLTKDLLCDWRHGYAHFREHLADHDTANDNGGWQWAASTGTDAQPYFRIFNPMTQGELRPERRVYQGIRPRSSGRAPDTSSTGRRSDANGAAPHRSTRTPSSAASRREEALAMFERAVAGD